MERSFVMFKPDCLERGLLGRMVSRFEEKGLRLVAMKMLRITPELSRQHYAEHVNKPFYPHLEQFITAAPVVASVFEGGLQAIIGSLATVAILLATKRLLAPNQAEHNDSKHDSKHASNHTNRTP